MTTLKRFLGCNLFTADGEDSVVPERGDADPAVAEQDGGHQAVAEQDGEHLAVTEQDGEHPVAAEDGGREQTDEPAPRGRKRQRCPENHTANKHREARSRGQAYISSRGKQVAANCIYI